MKRTVLKFSMLAFLCGMVCLMLIVACRNTTKDKETKLIGQGETTYSVDIQENSTLIGEGRVSFPIHVITE